MSASERWKKKKAGVAEDPNEAKNKETMLRLTGLADMVARVHLPSVAIGGIGLSNAAAVMATGVGGIAVVSAICAAADPAQAASPSNMTAVPRLLRICLLVRLIMP